MLAKRTHPHLNRHQRRHPEAYASRTIKGGVSWLITALLVHVGLWVPAVAKPVPSVSPIGAAKSAISKWAGKFRDFIGAK
jgi:hypothetical protein